jgi:hypothetical protein
MAIKNYTSIVKSADSLGKIQTLLAEHGARRVQMEYEEGKPVSLSFSMIIGGHEIFFRLTVDVAGMLQAMKNDPAVPPYKCTKQQAERTAWKNKYEWLHIQLSEVEANQARMEQLLLGYAVTNTGETAFERMMSGEHLLTAKNS